MTKFSSKLGWRKFFKLSLLNYHMFLEHTNASTCSKDMQFNRLSWKNLLLRKFSRWQFNFLRSSLEKNFVLLRCLVVYYFHWNFSGLRSGCFGIANMILVSESILVLSQRMSPSFPFFFFFGTNEYCGLL